MQKYISLPLFAVGLLLGACSDDALPTGAERDLLHNPDNAVALGTSEYGQILDPKPWDPGPVDPVDPAVPDVSDKQKPGYIHIVDDYNLSKYKPGDQTQHIKDDYNRSKYKPSDYEHIKTGDDNSKYKPTGAEHYNGPREIDKSKYIPSGYKHITSGTDETRYSKTGTSAGETEPVGEEPIGHN